MTRQRRPALLLALLIPIGALAARGQSPVDSVAARIALGRTLFDGKGLCFSCHGKTGEGVLGPTTRLAGRPLTHTKATLPDLIALIKSGVDSAHSTSGQVMPARGGSRITDVEVTAVAAYVIELQKTVKADSTRTL